MSIPDTTVEPGPRILVVRLGAMGDILHTLPAVTNLKMSLPRVRITWLVEPKWAALLEDNQWISDVALLRRDSLWTAYRSARALRKHGFDLAIDFQGLLKSSVAAWLARPKRIIGFGREALREPLAAFFYTECAGSGSTHVVDRNLDLACGAGAQSRRRLFPLPAGHAEGILPVGPFVLTSPLAGWGAKQWPLERYTELASLVGALGLELVVNGGPDAEPVLRSIRGASIHISGIAGLIHATRRARAVVGLDSGPMHLAAALDIPGVAIFGPTDPARNGPYGSSFSVLRASRAVTTYQRRSEPDAAMKAIGAEEVAEAIRVRLAEQRESGSRAHG